MKENEIENTMEKAQRDRILFGSCNSQEEAQPLWSSIISRNASAFVWGGDAVYADTKRGGHHIPAELKRLSSVYEQQLNISEYQRFVAQGKTIIGTFDDHDFGINNGDRTYAHKQQSAERFIDFLYQSNKQKDHLSLMDQRASAGKGVYGVFAFDFELEEPLLPDERAGLDPSVPSTGNSLSEKSVAIFLLDVRSNKSPWVPGFSNPEGEFDGDFLGEEQWKWFEESLSRSTARVNVVVTGLQVHPDRWFDGQLVEEWSRYPASQHRLYQALLQPSVRSPMIVSGDVHMAEYSRRDCQKISDMSATRSLIEVTTSGMTHSWGTLPCFKPMESFICAAKYVQWYLGTAMHLAHINHGWTHLIDDHGPSQERAKRRVQYSLDLNFGEFEFDWEREEMTARILGLGTDEGRPPLLSSTWGFAELSGDDGLGFTLTGKLKDDDFRTRFDLLSDRMDVAPDDWICLNHQGVNSSFQKFIGPFSALCVSFTIFYVLPVILPILLFRWIMRRFTFKSKVD